MSCGLFGAEKLRFGEGGELKAVGEDSEGKYVLAVAEIKSFVENGECKAAKKAIEQLKKDFPEVAGRELDAYMKAELLFCKGKLDKAARAYNSFVVEHSRSELYDAVLERQYSIATAYLHGRKKRVLKIFKIRGYAEGVRIMERVSERAGYGPLAVKACTAIAESYEKRGKWEEAYARWSEVSSRWPSGETGKEALLRMAKCKHAAYRGPEYDGAPLVSARSYYENFRLRYPEDAQRLGVDEKMKQIDEQLAYKELKTGQYYESVGKETPAKLYYQMVMDAWPESEAAKVANEKLNQELESKKQGEK
jgi:TolA-binding protein